MTTTSQATFEKIHKAITTARNYVDSGVAWSSMDNWAVDSYKIGDWFARSSDSGYSQYVGKKVNGRVAWRVDFNYGKPMAFYDITPEAFEAEVAAFFAN